MKTSYDFHINGTNAADSLLVPNLPYLDPNPIGTAYINGYGGNDTVYAQWLTKGEHPYAVVNGGAGNDTIGLFWGNPGTGDLSGAIVKPGNTIDGGAGNDTMEAIGWSILKGGTGSDNIWMGSGNDIYTDGQDVLHLDYAETGDAVVQTNAGYDRVDLIKLHGATVDTKFDFSHLDPTQPIGGPIGPTGSPFALVRSDFSFDAAGNLKIVHADPNAISRGDDSGTFHQTVSGTTFHNDAQFDAAIAAGHVIV